MGAHEPLNPSGPAQGLILWGLMGPNCRLFYRVPLLLVGCLLPSLLQADVRTELRWQADQFLSSAYDATSMTGFHYLGAHLKSKDESAADPFRVDFQGAYAVGAPLLSYLNLREISYTGVIGDRQTFSIGRKRERWSDLDRRWSLGLVEPVFRWNPLTPESQGLTGFFWEVKDGGRRLGLFTSFLFLPDQGPSFDINGDGEFARGNPWFRRPPESIRILSEVTQIEYRLEKPVETEVVFQPTFGARVAFGEEGPVRFRLSHLYKPMNQLALGYKGYLDLARDRGVVDLRPGVVFHHVTSTDAVYVSRRFNAGVSVVVDRPLREKVFFEDEWTEPRYEDAVLASPYVDVLISPRWKLSLQTLHVSGGRVSETGPEARSDRPSISGRYPHRDAAQVSAETLQRFSGSRLSLRTSLMGGTDGSFLLWKGGGRWDSPTGWTFGGEFQLVQTSDAEPEERVEIRDYANNDRLVLGVGYAF